MFLKTERLPDTNYELFLPVTLILPICPFVKIKTFSDHRESFCEVGASNESSKEANRPDTNYELFLPLTLKLL